MRSVVPVMVPVMRTGAAMMMELRMGSMGEATAEASMVEVMKPTAEAISRWLP
jgi:hypothetical protein